MSRTHLRFVCLTFVLAAFVLSAPGQVSSTSSLSGAVTDRSGAVVPGAEIGVKNNATNDEYRAISANNGTFSVPALAAGTYTVTVSLPGFKQAVIQNVKLDISTPATVNVMLEVGAPTESIVVQGSGAEVLQTQSANVSTTITGRQITELPFVSRNATDLLLVLPGTVTPGRPRTSSFNGLPQAAINMTLDGLNIQDNGAKNNDGFYTNIYPRVDAVEEVTLSTATPGAESSSEGAVQIKMVTRQGGNEYHGSIYEYLRNPVLNANYWFNNRDLRAGANDNPATFKAPRDRLLLNQYGFRAGGPISIPKLFSGRDRAFFFINYEEFRLATQVSQTRSILDPLAQKGIFQYKVGPTTIQQVDLMALAVRNGRISSLDPTVSKLLGDIRGAAQSGGSIEVVTDPAKIADPNIQRYTFSPTGGGEVRLFPTMRLDFNLGKRHHFENTYIPQHHHTLIDYLNNGAPQFPGFPSYGTQISTRFNNTTALRSTLSASLVNEVRFGFTGGTVVFNRESSPGVFTGTVANQGGLNLAIGAADGINTATVNTGPSYRNTPIKQFNDTVSWTRGTHSLNFGMTFTQVNYYTAATNYVPTVNFGVDATDATSGMFVAANFPGAASADVTRAQGIYATLVGSVTSINANARLNEDTGKYVYLGTNKVRARMRETGYFAQDSWRMRQNLTLNFGLRWEVQFPVISQNNLLSTGTLDSIWGVSGPGNLFKPGSLTGSAPQFIQFKQADKAFNTDFGNFAPSLGFAWSPNWKDGVLGKIIGGGGRGVIRGGYSVAYNRDGINTLIGTVSGNPGGSITVNRNVTLGNLGTLPVLLAQPTRLGPPSFSDTPTYPFTGAITDSMTVYDPSIKMPYVMSWTLGFQRELNRDMALEVRYVGNRGLQLRQSFNVNELDLVESGLLSEFKLAQANLQANIAAGRGNTFAYTGAPGTSPLPITLGYFSGLKGADVTSTARYTSNLFTSSTYVNTLSLNNSNPGSFAGSLEGTLAQRNNALAAGLASNLFRTNPGLASANITGNGGHSYYDSAVVELRRRLSRGFLFQGSYAFARGFSLFSPGLRAPVYKAASDIVITQALKADWIYDLPVGRGHWLLGGANGIVDHLLGGWAFHGTTRIQSGAPFTLSGIRLVGMTRQELQNVVKMRFDAPAGIAYYLPQDIINNTILAFNSSATSATGYSSQGVPQGRYLAPPNTAGCIETFSGQCGTPRLTLFGPRSTRFDLSLLKKTKITERVEFEFRTEFLNAFNNANFSVGSPNNSTTAIGGLGNATFGRVTNAYRDISTTNDPGGRIIQFAARITF